MVKVFEGYEKVWKRLTPEAKRMVCFENHERLFDQAKKDVRAWEKANLGVR